MCNSSILKKNVICTVMDIFSKSVYILFPDIDAELTIIRRFSQQLLHPLTVKSQGHFIH